MDVTEALEEAQARVEDLRRKSNAARDHYIQIERDVKEAEAEAQVLRRIVQRHELPAIGQHQPPLPQEIQEWQGLDRTMAIERILQAAGMALSPKQIARELRDNGRDDDDPHAVSAALAHLKRQGRARQEERGRWVRIDKVTPGEGPAANAGLTGTDVIMRELMGSAYQA
jgi:hypothetical protein